MKKAVLFSVLALTSSIFADGELVAAAQKMNGQSQQQMSNNNSMMNMVTLTSARPESDNGWYLYADALYWHADVGNADWANRSVASSTSNSVADHKLDFKWSWGFKAGIGVNMDHDMWDTNLTYTWFRTENSNSIGLANSLPAGSTQDITLELPAGSGYSSAKHRWEIHFSMFDWELGRWHYVSKNLALRPHAGVKGGWIHQNRHVHSTISRETETGHFENDFWGVGPALGVNTMWVLGNAGVAMDHRFSLLGDVGAAIMYGHFENSYSTNRAGTTKKISGLDRNLAVPMLQTMMGLSWDTAFNKGRNHFMFKVGYEFQYWFRQNQYPSIDEFSTSGLAGFTRYSDDLSLQGVTGEIRFDF